MSHNAISTLHLSNGTPSTPTPQPHQTSQRVSKAILKTAIQKANSAVVLDKANDLTGAIEAYTEAVNLLDRVLSTETRENDRQRLQETYDKYLKRIQYLTTLRANTSILHDTIESNHNKKEENGKIKAMKNNTLGNQQQINTATRQSKGQYSKWVRKMASSSSLDSKSSRLEIEINSSATTTAVTANTNTNTRYSSRTSGGSVTTAGSPRWQQNNTPSSPISLPLDAPPSPVSSKSTPSRPISNKKSNDTLNTTSEPPPPLEPRSVYRPNPRKSSRSGAAAALQHHFEPPSTPATPQQFHHERKTSLSSISSSSSEGSDHIGVPNSQQPSMALPSLLATKMEVTSATSIQLDNNNNNNNNNGNNNNNSDSSIIDNSSNTSNNDNDNTRQPVNDTITNENNIINNNKQNEIRHSSFKFSTSSSSNNNEEINNNNNNSNSNVLGRLRTSSLPRKLQFSRTNSGSSNTSRQRQLSESNDSTSTTTSSIPMRRNVTQPSVTMPSILSEYQDTTTTNMRSSTVQRQSSGLSMRKKYNRQSRTSMDKDKSSSSGGGSGPMFSHFFGNGHQNGISKEFNAFSPTSTNRSSDDNLEYFGNNQNSPYDSDSTNTSCSSSLPDHNQQQQSSTSSSKHLENHLKLIMALESSMNYGGYITPKLFIPKNLWHHNNIRLPSMDVKVAACESLILDLNRIEKWKNLDDIRGSLRLIESLEEVVEGLQVTLSKKLKRDSLADTTDDNIIHSPDGGLFGSTNNHNSSSMSVIGNSSNNSIISSGSSTISNGSNGSLNKRTQFMSWGSKLSKSVERMNAFSLTKVEDQHRHYIEVLQKLFIKLHLLEMWFQHYLKKDRQKNPHYDTLLSKLGKVCEGINRVVGGFVLRDVAILLGKWLKRGGTWVNE